MAVLVNVLWGSAWPSIKIGNEQFNVSNVPEQIMFAGFRFFGAGMSLLIIYAIIQKKIPMIHKENDNRKMVFFQMIFQTFLQYMFSYIGAANISGTNSSIFSATNTFFMVLLAHFVYADDKLNKKKYVSFTESEKIIPRLFGVVYCFIIVTILFVYFNLKWINIQVFC